MFLVPFPLVLALLLFLFAQSALAGPSKRGDWRQLSTGKTLSGAFGSEIYSWDSDINWDLCKSKKNKVKVWPLSRGRDNGKKISTAVRDVSKKGGGVVVLMKGEFNLYTAITLASNVCVRGQGRKKTVLKVAGEKKDVDKGVFRASYRKHITIAHLTIDGGRDITEWKSNAKKVKYGINLHATNYAWMKRVDVVGFSKSGCKFASLSPRCISSILPHSDGQHHYVFSAHPSQSICTATTNGRCSTSPSKNAAR